MFSAIRKLSKLVIGVFLASMASCAFTPPETVELSGFLGEMITHARNSHISIINRHFTLVEKNIDEFALGEYKEAFLANVRKLMAVDPNFTDLTPEQYDKAMTRVMRKRLTWIKSAREDKQALLSAIEEYYSIMMNANAKITCHLQSITGLDGSRNDLIDMFGSKIRTKAMELETKLLKSSQRIDDMLGKAIGTLME